VLYLDGKPVPADTLVTLPAGAIADFALNHVQAGVNAMHRTASEQVIVKQIVRDASGQIVSIIERRVAE